MDYLDAKLFSIRLTFTLHTFSENRLYWSSFCCVDADFLTPFAEGIALFDTPFLYNSRSWFCCVSTVIVDSDVSLNCCSKSQKNWNLSKFSWIKVHLEVHSQRNDFVDKCKRWETCTKYIKFMIINLDNDQRDSRSAQCMKIQTKPHNFEKKTREAHSICLEKKFAI